MAVSAGEVEVILRLRDEMTASLKLAVQQFDKAGASLKNIGTQATAAAGAMLPLSAVVSAAGAAAFGFGKNFEKTMTQVITLAGVGADEIDGFTAQVMELSKISGKGPNELAEALYFITSSGLKGESAMRALTASAKASAIGLGETKVVADAATSAVNAYGEANLSSEEAVRVLIATVREGKGEADAIAGAIGRVIAVANNLGVSFADVGSFMAATTRVGLDAEESATALRGALTTLEKPTKQQTEAFKELISQGLLPVGFNLETIRRKLQDEGLAQAFIGLTQATHGNVEALTAIIGNVRAATGVLSAYGTQAKSTLEIQGRIRTDLNELNGGFQIVSQTVDFKWKQALANAESAAVSLFNVFKRETVGFVDLLGRGTTALVDFVQGMADWPPLLREVTLGFGALVAIAAPALFAIGTAAKVAGFAFEGLTGMLGGMSKAAMAIWDSNFIIAIRLWVIEAGGLTAAIGEAGAAILDLALGPVGIIIAAIGALLLVVRDLTGSWDFLLDPLKRVGESLGDLFGIVGDLTGLVKDLASSLGTLLGGALKDLAEIIAVGFYGAFHPLLTWLDEALEKAGKLIGLKSLTQGNDMGVTFGEIASNPAAAALKAARHQLDTLAGGMDQLGTGPGPLGATAAIADLTESLTAGLVPALKSGDDALKEFDKSTRPPIKTLDTMSKEMKSLIDELQGGPTKMKEMAAAIAEINKHGGISDAMLHKVADDIRDFQKAGLTLPPVLEHVLAAEQKLSAQQGGNGMGIWGPALEGVTLYTKHLMDIQDILVSVNEVFAETRKGFGDIGDLVPMKMSDLMMQSVGKMTPKGGMKIVVNGGKPLADLLDPIGPKIMSQLEAAAIEFPTMLATAIINGQGLGQAIKGLMVKAGGDIGQTIGAKLGTKVGSKLGGSVGGMMSGLLGGLMSGGISMAIDLAIKGLSKLVQHFAVNNTKLAREDLAKNLGFDSLSSLYDKLTTMGTVGQSLRDAAFKLGKNDTVGNKAWMDAVTKFLKDFNDAMGVLSGKLKTATSDLDRFGGKVSGDLQPLVQQILAMPGLTDDMRAAIQGLAGDPSWESLQKIAEEYGIALEGLGTKFQQAKLDALAVKYATDFKFLIDNGADLNAVLHGMQDEVETLVLNALQFGTAIPENMRGLLQAMEDAGLLTDEFGNALTDLSRFNFKDKIEDPFDRIAKVLEQIRDLLASGIPGALGNLPVLVPHPPNQGGGQQGSQNVPGLAMGGIVTRPTMAMVGEAGPEAIIPLDQMGDGGTTVNVTVVAWDARSVSEWLRTGGADELAYHIVPKIPNAVKRFGL